MDSLHAYLGEALREMDGRSIAAVFRRFDLVLIYMRVLGRLALPVEASEREE